MGLLEERRELVIEAAIQAHKILPQRREFYRGRWNENPVATEALLRELTPVPPEVVEAEAEPGLPPEWFGQPRARAQTGVAAEGLPWVPIPDPARRGRVTFAGDD
jgi:hypothetical protein